MRGLLAIAMIVVIVASVYARAAVELIEVSEEQHLRRAEGVVYDPRGSALPNVQVSFINRRTGDVVATTETHMDGYFIFRHLASGTYDMKLQARGMNPMLYHLRIDHQGPKELLIIKMSVAS